MESSQIFGFLKILSESIKLTLKNIKLIASITALSLFLTWILLFVFSFFYQSASAYIRTTIVNSSPAISFLLFTLLLAVELAFLFAFIAIAQASGIATVITTATSYTDGSRKLSLQDVFSSLKTKWRSPLRNQFRLSQSPNQFLGMAAVAVGVVVVILYLNPITIAIVGIVGVAIFVYQLYASVVWSLSLVIPVVEEGCSEASEAVARAEKLVEGQRLDGFMVNLLLNIVWLIILLSFWMIAGNIDLYTYGLFLFSSVLVIRISVSVLYTVYYFRCKDYHADKIPHGNFHYTTLTNDIP